MQLIRKTADWFNHWYFIYELRTSLYMLEPWEKKLFNSCLLALIATGSYTTYVFLPRYAHNLAEFIGIV